jgi:filamentous hemagglutinin family protein
MRGAAFHRAARRVLPALALLPVLLGGGALATPKGAVVVSGNVQIAQSGNLTTIKASNLSIIQYLSFNIAQSQTVQFIQPSAQSKVLNRVLGEDPSIIAGTLLSNGQVYIVNPAGIFFANGCLVNVGGIYAAAGHISNQDFLANINRFTGLSGAVINDGLLCGNQVALIGNQVENFGAIVAPNGLVTLASGADVYLSDNDGQILIKLSGGVPAATGAGVTNSGTIQAAGGTVNLGAGDLYALAIFNNGQIKANAITVQGQAPGTAVQVSGTLDASSPYGVGGTINVLGDQIALVGATLNASGATGGGTILVGGDLHGANPAIQDASETCVSADSSINADALVSGNGGKVVVWSNLDTQFYGSISARGGAESGNGGNVEVSGGYLVFQGTVDTLAPNGTAGNLLLDPTNLVIDNGSNQNINGSSPFVPTGSPSELTWATIQTNLGLGDVTVTTSGSPAAAGQNGDITVAAASPDLASANKLTLSAVGTLYIDATITNSGGGALEFSGANGIQLGANVTSTGPQTYDNPVTLTGSVTLTASKATFSSTVDSDSEDTPRALTISGNAEFDGQVGSIAPLETVSVTGATDFYYDASVSLAMYSVQTIGDQNYVGPVTLHANTVLEADYTGNGVVFGSTVDSDSNITAWGLIILGNAQFYGAAGGTYPLSALGVYGAATIATGTINTTTSNGGYGQVAFGGAVTIADGLSLTIQAPGTTPRTAGALRLGPYGVSFFETVDGQSEPGSSSLTVEGAAYFGGAVGSNVALGALTVTGTTYIDTGVGNIFTSVLNGGAGTVFFEDGAVTIADGISLNITAPTEATFYVGATLDGTVAGTSDLTITGNAAFDSPVGSSIPLGSVKVTGMTFIATDTIATSTANGGAGTLTFGGGVELYIGVSATVTAPTLALFESTLDGYNSFPLGPGSSSLTISGNAEFDGPVGSLIPLGALQVTGTTLINTGAITTSTLNSGAGKVTFDGAVTIADGVSVNITAPTLARFESTVDGYSEAGSSSLTIAGNAEFDNAVGSNIALGLLEVTGTTLINTDAITASASNGGFGAVTFEGAVTIADGVSVNITVPIGETNLALFSSTVDGLSLPGSSNLTVTGHAEFDGQVGGNVPLGALEIITGGAFISTDVIATSTSNGGAGTVTFVGPVGSGFSLADGVALTITAPTLAKLGTVYGYSEAGSSSVTVVGNAELDGTVGAFYAPFGSLRVTGTTLINTDTITTSTSNGGAGTVTFYGAVTIADGVSVSITAATLAKFESTVDGVSTPGESNLTVTGNAEFGGQVGSGVALGSLDITGATLINSDGIATSTSNEGAGTVTFGGGVTTVDGVSVNVTAPTLARFQATVDGQVYGTSNLTVTGNAEFDGPVGSNVPLGSLVVTGTTLINSETIATSTSNGGAGDVTFGGAVTVADGVPAYITAPTLALFQATVDGQSEPGSSNLTVAGNAVLDGRLGSGVPFGWFWVTGTTLINTDTIAASTANGGRGEVEFGGAVRIADGISVNITAPGLPWFQGTVDGESSAGASNLTVTTSNSAQFEGPVGSSVPLGSLEVAGTTLILTNTIATSTLDGGAGTVTFGGAVTIWPGISLNITAPTLARFEATVDADGQSNLTVTGNAEFDGRVGSNVALGLLDVTGTTLINTDTITTSTSNGGAGTVTFGGAVTIVDSTSLTITAPTLAWFQGSVDGNTLPGTSSLTVSGNAQFDHEVGQVTLLASLYVSGATTVNTEESIKALETMEFVGPVKLEAASVDLDGETVTFDSTVDGACALRVAGPGVGGITQAVFNGEVGSGTPLASLYCSSGTTVDTDKIITTGTQEYGGAVTLAAAATTMAGTTVTFDDTVDGACALNIAGAAVFKFGVGNGTPLASLYVAGTTAMGAGNVTTIGDQTYVGAVTLESDVTVQSNGGNITFDSTIDADAAANNRVLTLTAGTGNVVLGGVVGGSQPPMSLYITAHNITLHDVHTSLTAGIQDYSATGVIEFESDYTGWDFTVNTNRSTPPSTATIYKDDGDLTIQFQNSVTMSENDKLCVSDGDVDITALTSVTLSDVYASGSIVVTSPAIQILTHPPCPVQTTAGQEEEPGVEIVGKSITFSTAPTEGGDDPQAPPVYATSTGTVTNPGPGTVVQFTPVLNPGDPVAVSPIAGGTVAIPAAGFAIALASYNPLTSEEAIVTPAAMTEVVSSGIFANASSFEEMMTILESQRLYPGSSGSGAFNSTTSRMATEILQSYRDLLWEKVKNAQSGQVELVSRAPAIRQLFDSALDAYRPENPQFEVGNFCTFLFGKFNRSQEARNLAERLALLCEQVEKLGLTPAQSAVAKGYLFRDLCPGRITPKDFEAIIRSALPSTVAGEKNLPPKEAPRAGPRRRWSA